MGIRLTVLALSLVLLPAPLQAQADPRTMYASVVDGKGVPVLGLGPRLGPARLGRFAQRLTPGLGTDIPPARCPKAHSLPV